MPADLIQTPQTLWRHGAYQRVTTGSPLLLVADVVNGVGESRYSALRLPGAAGGYQVTAGKTLYITQIWTHASAALTSWQLESATADAGDSQIAAPAGITAEDSRTDNVSNPWPADTAILAAPINAIIDVAAGRYPCIRNRSASSTLWIAVTGHEE